MTCTAQNVYVPAAQKLRQAITIKMCHNLCVTDLDNREEKGRTILDLEGDPSIVVVVE